MPILHWFLCLLVILTPNALLTGMHAQSALGQVDQTTVSLSHPRLFFDATMRQQLRANAAGSHGAIWAPIYAYVQETKDELPPVTASDEGLSTYRNFGNRLIAVAFACVISEEPALCTLAKEHLRIYAGWTQWGEEGARDLGLAHMLLGNALAYDWLYDQLTPAERTLIRQSLASWAEKMYEASSGPKVNEWYNWWRNSYAQNHHWINHSALGMAALALLGEEEQAPLWLEQASNQIAQVQTLLNAINDGSWHEGVHYQNYGLTLMLPFLVNLRNLTGRNLLPTAYLRNYGAWRLYNYVPDTWEPILGYGDYEREWGAGYAPANVLRFLASEFQQGEAQWLADQLVAVDGRATNVWSTPWYVFEFLYYDPQVAPAPPTSLPLARHFPDLAAVIWRSSWQSDALVFGFKSGPYGGRALFDRFTQQRSPWLPSCAACELNFGHDHDDSNTFWLAQAGHWLAPETVGVEKTATAFHNAILIDGQGQLRPPAQYRERDGLIGNASQLETVISGAAFDYLRADATQRYGQFDDLQQVIRHVLFVRPSYFVMVDQLAATTPHRYSWISHFSAGVKVEGQWVRGDAEAARRLGVGIATVPAWQATTGNDGQPFIQIEPRTPQRAMRFVHLLWPTTADEWAQRPAFTLFQEDAATLGLRVTSNGAPIYTDDLLITYQPTGRQQSIGDYRYDGTVATLRYDAAGNLQRLAVAGATILVDQRHDRPLVSGLKATDVFSAEWSGNQVIVNSAQSSSFTLYAPKAVTLLYNGVKWPFTRQGEYIIFSGS
jgi:hypothetical protein